MRSRITSEEMPFGKLRLLEGSRGREFGCYSMHVIIILWCRFWTANYAECTCVDLSVLAYIGQGK